MARARFLPAIAVALQVAACVGGSAYGPAPSPGEAQELFGHLGPVPVPKDNPMTAAKVRLGRTLFNDARLSSDGSLSCRTCHRPDQGFSVAQPMSPAIASRVERRHVPTLINVAFKGPLLWDGRMATLEKQPLATIHDALHFNNSITLVVADLNGDANYRRAFRDAFGVEGITADKLGQAIATYERTLVFGDSRFDRYMDGDEDALTADEQEGLALFVGKAGCVACHHGPTLSDEQFHNLGVPDDDVRSREPILAAVAFDAQRMGLTGWADVKEDRGRELVTKDAADRGKFRTQSLRNVADTAPYMHNGALESLEDVVEFYDAGGGNHPNKSALIRPLGLSEREKSRLVDFLATLTGQQRTE